MECVVSLLPVLVVPHDHGIPLYRMELITHQVCALLSKEGRWREVTERTIGGVGGLLLRWFVVCGWPIKLDGRGASTVLVDVTEPLSELLTFTNIDSEKKLQKFRHSRTLTAKKNVRSSDVPL
jgi:hypothetical protein